MKTSNNLSRTRFGLTLSAAAIMFAMTVSVISCKKKDPAPAEDKETTSASDNSMAEGTSNDVDRITANTSEIAVGDSLSAFRLDEELLVSNCAVVTRDTLLKKITVTFNGQPCYDGRTRSGVLIFNYSGSTNGAKYYRNPGFNCVITSSNYVVDGNQMSVNKTINNTTALGFNPATTNMTWSVTANISIVKANGSGTVTWIASRIKTLLNTSDTLVYHGQTIPISWGKARVGITGNASGTTANGENFTADITSQLVRDMNCSPSAAYPGLHPFIQGTVDFTPGSRATRHIDYGSGTCDNTATVTVNGVSFTITIP